MTNLQEIKVILEMLWMMRGWMIPLLLLLIGWALYEAVENKWEEKERREKKKRKRRKQRMM